LFEQEPRSTTSYYGRQANKENRIIRNVVDREYKITAKLDTVSKWERNRNNIIDSFYQHNRCRCSRRIQQCTKVRLKLGHYKSWL